MRYCVIIVNLLGNGMSSSPGDEGFPCQGTSICDNVRLQALLLDSLGSPGLKGVMKQGPTWPGARYVAGSPGHNYCRDAKCKDGAKRTRGISSSGTNFTSRATIMAPSQSSKRTMSGCQISS